MYYLFKTSGKCLKPATIKKISIHRVSPPPTQTESAPPVHFFFLFFLETFPKHLDINFSQNWPLWGQTNFFGGGSKTGDFVWLQGTIKNKFFDQKSPQHHAVAVFRCNRLNGCISRNRIFTDSLTDWLTHSVRASKLISKVQGWQDRKD